MTATSCHSKDGSGESLVLNALERAGRVVNGSVCCCRDVPGISGLAKDGCGESLVLDALK